MGIDFSSFVDLNARQDATGKGSLRAAHRKRAQAEVEAFRGGKERLFSQVLALPWLRANGWSADEIVAVRAMAVAMMADPIHVGQWAGMLYRQALDPEGTSSTFAHEGPLAHPPLTPMTSDDDPFEPIDLASPSSLRAAMACLFVNAIEEMHGEFFEVEFTPDEVVLGAVGLCCVLQAYAHQSNEDGEAYDFATSGLALVRPSSAATARLVAKALSGKGSSALTAKTLSGEYNIVGGRIARSAYELALSFELTESVLGRMTRLAEVLPIAKAADREVMVGLVYSAASALLEPAKCAEVPDHGAELVAGARRQLVSQIDAWHDAMVRGEVDDVDKLVRSVENEWRRLSAILDAGEFPAPSVPAEEESEESSRTGPDDARVQGDQAGAAPDAPNEGGSKTQPQAELEWHDRLLRISGSDLFYREGKRARRIGPESQVGALIVALARRSIGEQARIATPGASALSRARNALGRHGLEVVERNGQLTLNRPLRLRSPLRRDGSEGAGSA